MSTSSSAEAEQKVPARAWAILAVTYLASVVAPMVQFKVPAMAPWLFSYYHMTPVSFGYLMTSMTFIGVILAFPAAFICRGLGLKATMLLSVACLGAGSVWGGMTDSLTVLMISRMVEGAGVGLIGVAAPTCISIWFPAHIRGRALGIWATWVPFGIVFMFNLAPMIANTFGFKAVFHLCGAICLVAFVAFAMVFRLPEGESSDMHVEGSFGESLKYINNRYIWILGAVFFLFSFCTLGIANTFYNTFLVKELGFSPQAAGTITSINMIISLVSAPLAGYISDIFTPEKKRYVVVSMLALTLVSVFFMFVTGAYAYVCMWVFVAIQGFAGGEGGGAARPIAPLIMGRTAMGATMSMAVLQFCQNLGQSFGSPIFGAMLERYNWLTANLILEVPLLILGLILALNIRINRKKPQPTVAAELAMAAGAAE